MDEERRSQAKARSIHPSRLGNIPGGKTAGAGKGKKRRKGKKSSQASEEDLLLLGDAESVASVLFKSYSGCLSLEEGREAIDREEFGISAKNLVLLPDKVPSLAKVVKGFPNWKKEMSSIGSAKGAPLWIILCSSADRCVAVLKDLSDLRKSAKFGKLFSRHMKVQEQVFFLERSTVHVAVGTPARVLKLCDLGSLSLDKTKVVFFDKAVDVKMRNLFTMKDVQKDLWTFYETHMESLLKKGQIEVSLL